MSKVVVRKKIKNPTIGTWEWSKEDYGKPLVFNLVGAKAMLFLDTWNGGSKQREIAWHAVLELHFEPAPRSLITGLTTSGKQSVEAAQLIYEHYLTVFGRFESLLYTVGKSRSMRPEIPISFEQFFPKNSSDGDAVTFGIDSRPKQDFTPKIGSGHRRILAVFKRAELIDRDKWRRMQEAIDAKDFAPPEVLELFRIRSKLEWWEPQTATLEAAIFAETSLRKFIVRALESRGISRKKLKDIENDLSFSVLLNALLPMAIPKGMADRLRPHIASVDQLRRIRNDLVHGNIEEKDINVETVRKGIEGTLRIVETIRRLLVSGRVQNPASS